MRSVIKLTTFLDQVSLFPQSYAAALSLDPAPAAPGIALAEFFLPECNFREILFSLSHYTLKLVRFAEITMILGA